MKSQLRKLARKMSTWPVVGRFVRIGVAIIRLPDLKQRQFEFETAQLPELLQNITELQTELTALRTELSEQKMGLSEQKTGLSVLKTGLSVLKTGLSVLNTEVPILKTEIPELKTGLSTLNTEIPQLKAEIPELKAAITTLKTESDELNGLQHELETELSEHDNTIKEIDSHQPFQTNLVDSLPVAIRHITRDMHNLESRLDSVANTVNYVDNRVEFVRRELMYEMRYGASSLTEDGDGLKAKTEILSPEKLAAARHGQLRVNLGCGHKPLEGYLNVDRRALPGVDIVAEVDELPFEQGEVDEIFSAHLLEHFPQEQLKRTLLNYWSGLLKPGGEFRAIVPDGDGMIKAYASGEYAFQQFRNVTYGAQDYDGDFHFNMFTPSSLSELLAEASFDEARILADNRENKGCKEFEISARRK